MALRKFCFCCFFLTKYISMPSTTKQKRDTLKNCSVFWEKKTPDTNIHVSYYHSVIKRWINMSCWQETFLNT